MKEKEKEKFGRNQFILMFFAFSFGMILSNLIAQKRESTPVEASSYLFVYKGIDKGLDDVSIKIKEQLTRIEEKKQHLLELAAIELHVHQYAADNELSIEEAANKLIVIPDVSEERISQFYLENQTTLNKPFYEVKAIIARRLKNEAIEDAKQNLLDSLLKAGDVSFSVN